MDAPRCLLEVIGHSDYTRNCQCRIEYSFHLKTNCHKDIL